ncbi:hypothetical protein HZC09_05530 [Candidatus Micrarchaeota archaeon]|nr:hypothetical protein [Candidatus Micrarchaeota archaeon]
MKVYPDANVFIAPILGEKNAERAELFFKKSADCLFELVVSKTVLGEVSQRLENRGTLWLQKFIRNRRGAHPPFSFTVLLIPPCGEDTFGIRPKEESSGMSEGDV